MPELGENLTIDTNGVASPNADSTPGESVDGTVSPTNHEDVADRAASLLQGLRRDGGAEADIDGAAGGGGSLFSGPFGGGGGGGGGVGGGLGDDQDGASSRASSMRVRRRRESADDERRARRNRRGVANKVTGTPTQEEPPVGLGEEPIPEASPTEEKQAEAGDAEDGAAGDGAVASAAAAAENGDEHGDVVGVDAAAGSKVNEGMEPDGGSQRRDRQQ